MMKNMMTKKMMSPLAEERMFMKKDSFLEKEKN